MTKLAALSATGALLAMTSNLLAVPALAGQSAEDSGDWTVIENGHVDVLGAAYEDDELELHIHDETNDIEHDPETTLLVVGEQARTTVPDDPAYGFLGDPGDPVWILPDIADPDLLFAGWATEEVPAGVFTEDEVTFTVHDAYGRGGVDLYTVDDFGTPQVLFDSDAGAGSWAVPVASHGHLNWAFTSPGWYRLTVEVSGVRQGTGEPLSSGKVSYWFKVER